MRIFVKTVILMAITAVAYAAPEPLRTFVSDFKVVGAPNGNELGSILPSLLAAKLKAELFTPVAKKEQAEVEISGSYVVFGKIFTLDATVKSFDDQLFIKLLEQGDKDDTVPAALDRLAEKIAAAVAKTTIGEKLQLPTTAPLPPTTAAAPAIVAQAAAAVNGTFREVWSSQPLDGAMVALAPGRKLASGEREVFIAGEQSISYYRLGSSLTMVAKIDLPKSFKILAIDTADLDGDGTPEIYLTAVDRETVASMVLVPKDGTLEKIATDLPYFFRGIRLGTGAQQIFAQEMGMNTDFYGDIFELVKNGVKFSTKNPQKLPEPGTIYNFNHFKPDAPGNLCAVINSAGYLAVKSGKGDTVWQSVDRFGGSETWFKRETGEQRSNLGEDYRRVFVQQRMIATADGSLILPRNMGSLVVGTMRSYDKHSLHRLKWNGSQFKEQLKSEQRPGYLADYSYDPATNELMTLEVTQKEGMISKGRSVITVLQVEP